MAKRSTVPKASLLCVPLAMRFCTAFARGGHGKTAVRFYVDWRRKCMYGYEWTDEYGIFRLTIDAKIQKEIRPVFYEELDFFGMDQFWDYPKDTDAPLLWAEEAD